MLSFSVSPSRSQATAPASWVSAKKLIIGLAIFVAALFIGYTHVDDSDPLGYYAILGLPLGVPLRVTTTAVKEAHTAVSARLKERLDDLDCQASAVRDSEDARCVQLRAELTLADDALRVLGDARSKQAYDSSGLEMADFHGVLGVSRDATFAQVRAAYESKTYALIDESRALGCSAKPEEEGGCAVPPLPTCVTSCQAIRRSRRGGVSRFASTARL